MCDERDSNVIHPTAVISESATIGENVTIGPFCVVDDNVTIGDGCILKSHVVVHDPTRIGKNNKFYQFSQLVKTAKIRSMRASLLNLSSVTIMSLGRGNRSPRHYSRQQHYYYRLSLFIYGQLSCCP